MLRYSFIPILGRSPLVEFLHHCYFLHNEPSLGKESSEWGPIITRLRGEAHAMARDPILFSFDFPLCFPHRINQFGGEYSLYSVFRILEDLGFNIMEEQSNCPTIFSIDELQSSLHKVGNLFILDKGVGRDKPHKVSSECGFELRTAVDVAISLFGRKA
ncbi:hypothetical protein Tco_1359699 [Tanacetum coccineum]